MTAQILDGELVAAAIKADLVQRVEALADRGITPGLGTILVGDDGPSANYVAMKHRDCAELGIASRGEHLPAGVTTADVLAVVDAYNADPGIDAVLIQYPFPEGVDYETVLMRLDPVKDADGLHPVNLGRLVMGVEAPLACTPAGIQALLEHYDIPIAGRHVVIVGRGLTIGRPLANLLTLKRSGANAAVTVVHTGVADLASYTRQADILVSAAGSP
jgi:methylenetetrahydrofolate dehydrogenase (NADP+)/methenyltetrahydrofolate cyclohydrolase